MSLLKHMERWRDIKGYEGLYQISNCGRVKSLKYCKEKILKSIKSSNGYLQVNLYKDGKRKYFLVHRLVATAFIYNIENYSQINHKDEIKSNNYVSNLEWCDYSYNNNYGTRNKKIADKLKKYHWYTNGVVNIYSNKPSLNGYCRGKTKF